ncbi:hypothetical protein F9L07_19840 [Pimelobacter simplex]|uniref:Uncharacterized protein n=1 Tax=Nocardioides simplex TaxID=2045 RepID=A0A7J5DVE0_NOCSI|nr:hypothetical protein [Pimelobacter simplex]KAB2809294.1 hypothetical protein F9L07_19840 [Pimelobacter simplex]
MSVLTLDSGQRVARKVHRCGMCGATIKPGDRHAFENNVYDGQAYTWRTCLPCQRDRVSTYVWDWTGGWADEGVDYEQAVEWAEEAVEWPKHWLRDGRAITTCERVAARNWLARATGGE